MFSIRVYFQNNIVLSVFSLNRTDNSMFGSFHIFIVHNYFLIFSPRFYSGVSSRSQLFEGSLRFFPFLLCLCERIVIAVKIPRVPVKSNNNGWNFYVYKIEEKSIE